MWSHLLDCPAAFTPSVYLRNVLCPQRPSCSSLHSSFLLEVFIQISTVMASNLFLWFHCPSDIEYLVTPRFQHVRVIRSITSLFLMVTILWSSWVKGTCPPSQPLEPFPEPHLPHIPNHGGAPTSILASRHITMPGTLAPVPQIHQPTRQPGPAQRAITKAQNPLMPSVAQKN